MAQALLVIDVQTGMFAFPEQPHDGEAVVDRITLLIERARQSGVAVVFVQHDAGAGKPLGLGQPGHALHPKLQPRPGEKCIVKRFSSAFRETDLDRWLREQSVDTLTICGMQSEYCVDSAVRGASERGYSVTLVSDAHTTFNTSILDAEKIVVLENQTLGGGFAKITPAADISYLK